MESLIETGSDIQPSEIDHPIHQEDASSMPLVTTPAVERVYRHALPVRIGHWLNVVWLFILIMSGLQIFNAHPAL